jgi:hypothetical protein
VWKAVVHHAHRSRSSLAVGFEPLTEGIDSVVEYASLCYDIPHVEFLS